LLGSLVKARGAGHGAGACDVRRADGRPREVGRPGESGKTQAAGRGSSPWGGGKRAGWEAGRTVTAAADLQEISARSPTTGMARSASSSPTTHPI
jgi:hypothetical protein